MAKVICGELLRVFMPWATLYELMWAVGTVAKWWTGNENK